MKKFVLLLSCSLVAASAAMALNTMEHLNAVKDIFSREFEKIDTDKDGVISADEYMLFQFMSLQKSLAEEAEKMEAAPAAEQAESSNEDASAPKAEDAKQDEKKPAGLAAMSDTTATLEEMANFELDLDEPAGEGALDDEALVGESLKPAKKGAVSEAVSVDGEVVNVPEIDLSVSEDESLKNILADMMKAEEEAKADPKTVEQEEKKAAEDRKQMEFMLNTIKKTLPKKIDNITSWTDIVYDNDSIDYIYQADVDVNTFSDAERKTLVDNIEKVACLQAYAEMCVKIKPLFIDKGIDMKIRYQDKNSVDISFCEFNNENCK